MIYLMSCMLSNLLFSPKLDTIVSRDLLKGPPLQIYNDLAGGSGATGTFSIPFHAITKSKRARAVHPPCVRDDEGWVKAFRISWAVPQYSDEKAGMMVDGVKGDELAVEICHVDLSHPI
jgi:hypothetical protein